MDLLDRLLIYVRTSRYLGYSFTSVVVGMVISFMILMGPILSRYMRTQFEGEASFTWLYQAPWDSLPAALVGLIVAFLHHQLQADGYVPADSLVRRPTMPPFNGSRYTSLNIA